MSTTATVVGNLTRDPELRFTPTGKPVADLGVVYNKRHQVDGKWEDGDPQFYDVVAFGSLAEHVSESLEKGTRVIVVGRLDYSSWETKDGDKRSKVKIVADEIGPSYRWASGEVHRNERSEPKQETFDPGSEPF